MYYNFCRVHSTLRVTPAMEAGICDHVWRSKNSATCYARVTRSELQTDRALILKALAGTSNLWKRYKPTTETFR
jgi:hypothetical protein